METLDTNLHIISALDDEPNSAGMTAAELKAKFDEAALTIQEYLNSTVAATINAMLETIEGLVAGTVTPDSVYTNAIQDGAVTPAKLSADAIPASKGGTGRTSLSAGYALVGNGTSEVALRAITNNTAATAPASSTNLVTENTLKNSIGVSGGSAAYGHTHSSFGALSINGALTLDSNCYGDSLPPASQATAGRIFFVKVS